MCVVLVPNIGISTSKSNTTKIRPQHFRKVMCVNWECEWCQCQILVLAPAYPKLQNKPTVVKKLHVCPLGMFLVLVPILVLAPAYSTLHKYAHSTSERSCVSTGNVRGTSEKYWYQHQQIQHYKNTPTALQKGHVCQLGMCVVLVPNIGISTSISNITQRRPQHFRKVMCVHWECAWCQCQILVLAPANPTLQKYAHSTSERSCVSTGNVSGASAKYWYQHQHIQNYKIRPQQLRNFMCVHQECAWCQCQILVLAPAYPTLHKYAHSTSERTCVSPGNVRGASAKYWYQHQHIQHYTNMPTALQELQVCPLGMCVVLVPNIGISTSISNITQRRPQHFRKVMCVHWECAWCQCQILVLAPANPTLQKYAHSTSERSCVSTGNVSGASAKYWYQHQHIQNYKIRPQQLRNFMCVHQECAWCQCQILVLAPAYPTLHKYAHSTSERTCVSPGNVRGASAKYWYQHQHIQHYTNMPTALQELQVCPLGMCVVLVPNIGVSTIISNTTQIRPQQLRNFMCVHWECAWCQFQIFVLAPAYQTLHKYAHSS